MTDSRTDSETAPPRSAQQREADVRHRLETDLDVWVATASPDGQPCMVPLSFVYVGGNLLMCTRGSNPTARNVAAGSRAVLGVGLTRDVVLIEADAEQVGPQGPTEEEGAVFVAKTAWDPRGRPDWVFLRFRPVTLRAWREENELAGRLLMRDGAWRTRPGGRAVTDVEAAVDR
ncbi:pyridoxamine 5'-phosphate oxidase family protein [Streptomyces sp. 549]|uniref:pyridoxamine 5'-phosphate oxidase family protein n=1 Tax=Streptomyces sp. 549 TaxID=3049076 RepID=UPI0024C3F9F7|nr:pyridoxamine 5'-phosphate oxidase family protein [Streptomyces sp. 549]MDK1474362.1 pyridoxamine 5'-phosphate oxidase family protein [Streptomyces sp. 549]